VIIGSMMTFAVVASRATPTNTRLGVLLSPAQAVARLRPGDVALGRLDILPSLHGIEPGLWALDLLESRGVRVLNNRHTLASAHDKLATADALNCAGIPHPPSAHVAPWLPLPDLEPPLVLKPRFGSWGRDVALCRTPADVENTLDVLARRSWFREHGVLAQELVPPLGWDLRIVVAGGRVVGAARRAAATGEWRTNVSLGGVSEPVAPPPFARALALQAAAAVRGDLVGVDLLPTRAAFVISEINGAVDFRPRYAIDFDDVYTDAALQLLRVAHARRVAA
jgi:RimK family alpha-L-glutamate ligase